MTDQYYRERPGNGFPHFAVPCFIPVPDPPDMKRSESARNPFLRKLYSFQERAQEDRPATLSDVDFRLAEIIEFFTEKMAIYEGLTDRVRKDRFEQMEEALILLTDLRVPDEESQDQRDEMWSQVIKILNDIDCD